MGDQFLQGKLLEPAPLDIGGGDQVQLGAGVKQPEYGFPIRLDRDGVGWAFPTLEGVLMQEGILHLVPPRAAGPGVPFFSPALGFCFSPFFPAATIRP